ncbi:MAG TPA: hypothetical protein VLH56_10830 [Dissulfurispiraceae bacterium]|nr:hypothetical protein [Dissulfurispiraceae bacterium]
MNTKSITKASGEHEAFQRAKLINSLVRVGASQDVAVEIAEEVSRQLPSGAHTGQIFRLAKRLLRKFNRVSGMRYSLKRAIYLLGPSGFSFERFFAKILHYYGYTSSTNSIVEGFCIHHEVDIIAADGIGKHMIECKYHNNPGKKTDVKVALYVHARFQDIKKACDLAPEKKGVFRQGWLVTNTRCSGDAIAFAECSRLKIVSWRYPEKQSLERMIEDKKLYPVTVLQFSERHTLDTCIANNIILVQDIAFIDVRAIAERLRVSEQIAQSLKKQASELIGSD